MSESPPPPSLLKRVWPFVKWGLFAVVVYFVARRARDLWDPAAFNAAQWRPLWLVPAVVAYLVGWFPSIWFWRMLLARLGADVGVGDATRAYYCGHLGKYIPGKALVLVIRAALLKDRGARPAAAALTAAYETLAMMAVGIALGVALAPSVLPVEFWQNAPAAVGWLWAIPLFRWLWTTPFALPAVIAVISLGVLPLLAKLATVAARKMVPFSENGTGPISPPGGVPSGVASSEIGPVPFSENGTISTGLFATGMLVLIAAWWIHGLSLGCVLCAVSGQPFDLAHWPAWTAAVSLATSLGFAAIFAPGGVGVREWVLLEVLRLQPGVTPEAAVATAVLLRLTWLLAEIVLAAGLYWGPGRLGPTRSPMIVGTRTCREP